MPPPAGETRAQLLDGEAWQAARQPALTDLQLPENPAGLPAEYAMVVHLALQDVGTRIGAGAADSRPARTAG
ncbi:hypothetical protein [Streptosporangium sp. NPDC048865]|uniref:hypothetical protein n=1 Tax=Streptosporangium sp. NPDC048865 TaxID=3155766 RepID=UPI003433A0D7